MPSGLPAGLAALAGGLLAVGIAVPAQAASGGAAFEVVRQADLTVARVGERLAIANLPLCRKTQHRSGMVLHDIAQYSGDVEGARRAFGFERDVSVEAVVPGSAADRAGITAGLGLVAIDGKPVDGMRAPAEDNESFARMAGVLNALDASLADGEAVIDGVLGGRAVRFRLAGDEGCASRFQLKLGGGGAEADGRYVQVDAGAFEAAKDDNDLAALMAHEFAHNVLEHRERLDAKDVKRGLLAQIGKNAGRIRATEEEADRLSVYLMLNAGYDPEAALPFWKDFLGKYDFGFLSDPSHPRPGDRLKMLRQEIAAARAMRAATPAGEALIPDFARPPFAPLP